MELKQNPRTEKGENGGRNEAVALALCANRLLDRLAQEGYRRPYDAERQPDQAKIMKRTLAVLLPAVVLAGAIIPNYTLAQSNLQWGTVTNGVQLGIALTQSNISAGSTITIHFSVKNSSTNTILLTVDGYLEDEYSAIALIDASGVSRDLRPHIPMRVNFYNGSVFVSTGELYECDIDIQIPKTIERGIYMLEVRRFLAIADNFRLLTHNRPLVSKPRIEAVSNQLQIDIQ